MRLNAVSIAAPSTDVLETASRPAASAPIPLAGNPGPLVRPTKAVNNCPTRPRPYEMIRCKAARCKAVRRRGVRCIAVTCGVVRCSGARSGAAPSRGVPRKAARCAREGVIFFKSLIALPGSFLSISSPFALFAGVLTCPAEHPIPMHFCFQNAHDNFNDRNKSLFSELDSNHRIKSRRW